MKIGDRGEAYFMIEKIADSLEDVEGIPRDLVTSPPLLEVHLSKVRHACLFICFPFPRRHAILVSLCVRSLVLFVCLRYIGSGESTISLSSNVEK